MREFTRDGLERDGFVGWVPFGALRGSDCPSAAGVYVVTYEADGPVAFREVSNAGWFKGKDPTVAMEVLGANWVAGAVVVYVGKAEILRLRLRQYADFGSGRPVGHWGGRLVFQLQGCQRLRVACKATLNESPLNARAALIWSFADVYTKPPFANAPHRLGK